LIGFLKIRGIGEESFDLDHFLHLWIYRAPYLEFIDHLCFYLVHTQEENQNLHLLTALVTLI